MKRFRTPATLAALGFATLVIPFSFVLAQGGNPLVLCDGINCQLCSLASLAQNIIKFTLLIAIPLAAILFAYAGALYVTARGNPSQIEKAHGIFGKVALGFVLALAGWLIVNTILVTIARPSSFSSGTDFFTIRCVTNRPTDKKLDELLAGRPSIDYVLVPEAAPFNQNTGCASTDYLSNGQCIDAFGTTYEPYRGPTPYTGSVSVTGTQQYTSQVADICQQYQSTFSDCARTAQAIMAIESNGRANAISPVGAVGLMQVMPATACGLDYSIPGCSTRDYATVRQNILDPDTNMRLGIQYLNQMRQQFNNDQNFIASYNGGPRANNPSVTCPGQTWWQCTANSGYAETRTYVQRFVAARNLLQ